MIWEENRSNLCVLWDSGREAEADAGFARAAKTVSLELINNRLVGNPMEPRVALGEYDAATESYTLHSPTQGVIRVQDGLARLILKVPKEKLRVISPDVGGGFGLRGKIFPEFGDGALGGEAPRPADQVDQRTDRDLPMRPAWPRPRDAGRDGLRRQWQDARGPHPHHGGDGRLPAGFRPARADRRRRPHPRHGL